MNPVDQIHHFISYQLFPARCVLCQNQGMPRLDLCASCLNQFNGAPNPKPCEHGTVYAGFAYQTYTDELIQGFKFHQQLSYGRMLARLAMPVINQIERPAALLPIPLHTQRLRLRGYNQSLELAKFWGKQTKIPVLSQVLFRHRATQVQSELKAAERLSNVRGAFSVKGVLPTHVALVDDVYTTGATCQSAAEALVQQGVQRVDVWCLARVI